jgi:hypothetical protein
LRALHFISLFSFNQLTLLSFSASTGLHLYANFYVVHCTMVAVPMHVSYTWQCPARLAYCISVIIIIIKLPDQAIASMPGWHTASV